MVLYYSPHVETPHHLFSNTEKSHYSPPFCTGGNNETVGQTAEQAISNWSTSNQVLLPYVLIGFFWLLWKASQDMLFFCLLLHRLLV